MLQRFSVIRYQTVRMADGPKGLFILLTTKVSTFSESEGSLYTLHIFCI